MKELVEKVAALYADFSKDANAQIENGNKAAGTREMCIRDRTIPLRVLPPPIGR